MFKQLQDMALFALVAEMGSFTAAAQKAELPKSSVSQRISQLEQQVGIRLLNRTTRKLNLTFAGEHYLNFAGLFDTIHAEDVQEMFRRWAQPNRSTMSVVEPK